MGLREKTIAKKCQLLTGSFKGSLNSCPCMSKYECRLSEWQRDDFKNDPEVLKQLSENRKEFERLKSDDNI